MIKKLSSDLIQAIVSAERPGFEICSQSAIPQVDTMDLNSRNTASSAPDLDYLRQKFLHIGGDAASTPLERIANIVDVDESQEIVQIRPTGDPSRAKTKAAIVSGKSRKITGEQG